MLITKDISALIMLSVFALAAIVQLWYYLYYYRRSAFMKKDNRPVGNALPPLSVVICARNEAENLKKFLPRVLRQDYPSYEVIVVNDCSEDDTFDILGELLKTYPHLKVSTIQKDPGFVHSKKLAMLVGIKAASNDLLAFTDADCYPVSVNWLRRIAESMTQGKDMVIGYGGYLADKSLINYYIRYETMFIGMQYTGMALAGRPYMGVGRNMAYRRSYFFDKGGFGPHNHIMSGDDDLFVNRNATTDNCAVMIEADSHTRSVPCQSAKEWIKQKQRHLTTARYYNSRDKVRLFLEPLSRVCYYSLLVIMLVNLVSWPVVSAIAFTRLIIRMIIMHKASVTFRESNIWLFSLIFDILAPLVSSILFLTNSQKGKRRMSWK